MEQVDWNYVRMYVCMYVCMYVPVRKLLYGQFRQFRQFPQFTEKQILLPLPDTKTQSIQHAASCLLCPISAIRMILSLFRSWLSVNCKIVVGAVG